MAVSKSKPYDSVSMIYNGLMSKVDYSHWANYIFSLIKADVHSDSKVLDLGAGNCNLAGNMRKFYPNLIAADISIPMLKKGIDTDITKICCDMTNLPFKNKFSLIYSTFDCVNYLLKKNLLRNLLKEISIALNENGIFTFDVCLERNSRDNIKKQVSEGSYSSIQYKQVSSYSRVRKIHKNIFTLYYPSGEVIREIHKQKIYSFNTYIRLFRISGLELVNCYETFTNKSGNSESNRVQFILLKRGK